MARKSVLFTSIWINIFSINGFLEIFWARLLQVFQNLLFGWLSVNKTCKTFHLTLINTLISKTLSELSIFVSVYHQLWELHLHTRRKFVWGRYSFDKNKWYRFLLFRLHVNADHILYMRYTFFESSREVLRNNSVSSSQGNKIMKFLTLLDV